MATIVFDLDGTLIDTGGDLLAATNAVMRHERLDPVERADLNHLVGHGGRAMIGKALAMHGRDADDGTLDRLVPVFLEHYSDNMPGQSKPFSGLIEALDRLDEAGHTFAVCTNKMEGLSNKLLEALGLRERFAVVSGPDTFGMRKPDPEHLLRTIAAANGDRDDAIMVGDSFNDVEAARRARVPSIGVPFGYTDTPINELSPDVVVEHYDELDDALIGRMLKA